MAADRAALAAAGGGMATARIYRWDGPWVSLGRFQKASDALRLDACERRGVRWVIRPTGGRAVLHGADVTVSIACPLAVLGVAEGQVRGAYRALAPILIEALNEVGSRAVLGEETLFARGVSRGVDCFRHVSANDIVDVEGVKLAGTALRLVRSAVLMQASIPTGPYLVAPSDIYRERASLGLPRATYPAEGPLTEALRRTLERRGYASE
jgi:lipoate-protein ligase A